MPRSVTLLLLTLLLLPAAPAPAQRQLGTLQFEPCGLRAPGLPASVDAFCATLTVPENAAEPGGRQIELAIGWVPSRADEALPDPVLLLAGGPGQSAREAFAGTAAAFRELRQRRHVLLVDQRGTGGSHRLACDADPTLDAAAIEDPAQVRAFVARCRDQLASRADLRFYTTSEAVADLERVRIAIGAERLNLIGGSYGSRVGLEYLRRYPTRTRTLVIDGVVPPQLALGNDHARNLEAALSLQFQRCEQDALCRERFGSPRARLDALLKRLRAQPVDVVLRDPVSGIESSARFGPTQLATVVRLFAYAPGYAAMLPLALAEADAGRYDLLLAQSRMIGEMLGEGIAFGMHLSVSCAEDADGLVVDPADAGTTLGTALTSFLRTACEVWPRGARPADFDQPVSSEAPVLLLSGELDPVTPARYAEQVLQTLPNGRHLVLRGAGHGTLGLGCMPRLLGQFVQDADARALDASCLERLDYTPPFAGFYGWEP